MRQLARLGLQAARAASCGAGAQLRCNAVGFASAAAGEGRGSSAPMILLGLAAVGGGLYYADSQGIINLGLASSVAKPAAAPHDYKAVKEAIEALMDKDDYDDGSFGPVLVRLAWHSSGTYDKAAGTGGSNGGTMRFKPESEHGANSGLAVARELLEPVKARFPWISYADLYTLAGATAIEAMGGPHIPWRAGRTDAPDGSHCPPDGRLPDASLGAAHVRDVFHRMGFNDQEAVALIGAHCLGRCHEDRSGFKGPWTNAPTTFSSLYFKELMENKWRKKKWNGPLQYEDRSGQLMMLPTDMALLWDRGLRKYVELYAKDEDKFFADFADAFARLLELGCTFPESTPVL